MRASGLGLGLGKTSFRVRSRALGMREEVKGNLEPSSKGRSPKYVALPEQILELTWAWADYVSLSSRVLLPLLRGCTPR